MITIWKPRFQREFRIPISSFRVKSLPSFSIQHSLKTQHSNGFEIILRNLLFARWLTPVPYSNVSLRNKFGIQFFHIFQTINWKMRDQSEKWMNFHVFGTVCSDGRNTLNGPKVAEPFSTCWYLVCGHTMAFRTLCAIWLMKFFGSLGRSRKSYNSGVFLLCPTSSQEFKYEVTSFIKLWILGSDRS